MYWFLIPLAMFFVVMIFAILRAGADDDRQADKAIKDRFGDNHAL